MSTEPTAPSGCRWCGAEERGHWQRWAPPLIGWHQWTEPTQEQIKERMHARRVLAVARAVLREDTP